MNYTTNIVPVLLPFFGDNTEARDVATLIVRFTGTLITDWQYAKFRAQVMALINKEMGNGRGWANIAETSLPSGFEFNETHALWLIDDLQKWGFSVSYREEWCFGGDELFMAVDWGFGEQPTDPQNRTEDTETFCVTCPTTFAEMFGRD